MLESEGDPKKEEKRLRNKRWSDVWKSTETEGGNKLAGKRLIGCGIEIETNANLRDEQSARTECSGGSAVVR